MRKAVFKILFFFFVSALFVPFAIIMLPVVKRTAMLGMDNQVGLIFLYFVYGFPLSVLIYTGYLK